MEVELGEAEIATESQPKQYFIPVCECGVKRALESDQIVVKEATTGYLDPTTQEPVGTFVTYVIELGVSVEKAENSHFFTL